jgi:flagellar biosynthesis/type III secretory pathway M-ring protein FliF/YscJ
LKGAFKRLCAAEDSSKAFKTELKTLWRNIPLKTKIVIWTVIAFVFVLVVPIF